MTTSGSLAVSGSFDAVFHDDAPHLWPGSDYELSLTGAQLTVGDTIQFSTSDGSTLLRVIEDLHPGDWRVRPTGNARPLDERYRRRQINRRRRR